MYVFARKQLKYANEAHCPREFPSSECWHLKLTTHIHTASRFPHTVHLHYCKYTLTHSHAHIYVWLKPTTRTQTHRHTHALILHVMQPLQPQTPSLSLTHTHILHMHTYVVHVFFKASMSWRRRTERAIERQREGRRKEGGVYLQRRERAQLWTPHCGFETNSFSSPRSALQAAWNRSVAEEMNLKATLFWSPFPSSPSTCFGLKTWCWNTPRRAFLRLSARQWKPGVVWRERRERTKAKG